MFNVLSCGFIIIIIILKICPYPIVFFCMGSFNHCTAKATVPNVFKGYICTCAFNGCMNFQKVDLRHTSGLSLHKPWPLKQRVLQCFPPVCVQPKDRKSSQHTLNYTTSTVLSDVHTIMNATSDRTPCSSALLISPGAPCVSDWHRLGGASLCDAALSQRDRTKGKPEAREGGFHN